MKEKKVVLMMLPYWAPLIPPQGIGCLKSYLEQYGYQVTCYDPNIDKTFKDIYNKYFDIIKRNVNPEKWGNFYNVGHDVLQNHLMAHICQNDKKRYVELVKILVYYTYFTTLEESEILKLIDTMEEFYQELKKYILNILETKQPAVVGFSMFKTNVPPSIFAARIVKEYDPNITVVGGGGTFADYHYIGSPNFNALVEECKGSFDEITVSGQGELILLKYLQGELPKDKMIFTPEDVNYEVIPFDKLTTADLDDFKIDEYPYIAATASCSCPCNCSFCNSSRYSGKYRVKDPKQTAQEMIQIYEKYHNQVFFLTDSLLNGVVNKLSAEFRNRGKIMYYDCYFRVDNESADINKTLLWRKGGLYRTRIGVESGSQKVLDLMHKGITVEQTKATLKGLASAGVKTTVYCVVGHPGETEEDFQMTLDLLTEMKDYIWQAECNPFYYHYSGQTDSDSWEGMRKLLYPQEYSDMLRFETWTLECEPSRKVRCDRMYRFVNHCKEIGIPNPYSAEEIYEADVRWRKLHKNAVPTIWEFKTQGKYIDDTDSIRKLVEADSVIEEDDEFEF